MPDAHNGPREISEMCASSRHGRTRTCLNHLKCVPDLSFLVYLTALARRAPLWNVKCTVSYVHRLHTDIITGMLVLAYVPPTGPHIVELFHDPDCEIRD